MYPAVLLKGAVVIGEATLPELIQEKVDARACSADHPRQRRLRYFGKPAGIVLFPIPGEQKKSTGESPLAAITNVID